jgi:hypothetical protein
MQRLMKIAQRTLKVIWYILVLLLYILFWWGCGVGNLLEAAKPEGEIHLFIFAGTPAKILTLLIGLVFTIGLPLLFFVPFFKAIRAKEKEQHPDS